MKNKYLLVLIAIMACSVCACGKQEKEKITTTESTTANSTEQITSSESSSEITTSEMSTKQITSEAEQISEASTEADTTADANVTTEQFVNKDNWPDVQELVNANGGETTVYLLADGRYMDRINAIYIYDGKDTWTDESGVKWSRATTEQ